MNETILMLMLSAIMIFFFIVGLYGVKVKERREAQEKLMEAEGTTSASVNDK